MKSKYVIALLFLTGSFAKAEMPKVICHLQVFASDEQGLNMFVGQSEFSAPVDRQYKKLIEFQGFALSAGLRQMCPPGARCSPDTLYALFSSVEKNGIAARSNTVAPEWRQEIELDLGNEMVTSRCDVEKKEQK